MLNRSGVTKKEFEGPRQILANVDLQYAVGAIIAQDVGATVEAKKIAKAGTPVNIDFMNPQTNAIVPTEAKAANGVLLHDVDVTAGKANGTVLLFGVVNVNRVEADVATKLEAMTDHKVGHVILVKR